MRYWKSISKICDTLFNLLRKKVLILYSFYPTAFNKKIHDTIDKIFYIYNYCIIT